MSVDSNDNAHAVYLDEYGTKEHEIWYTTLDSDGNTVIDDPMLTADDDEKFLYSPKRPYMRQPHVTYSIAYP